MHFASYLKSVLSDIVDSYKRYFSKTFGIALIYSVMCFIIIALLLRFSTFELNSAKKQFSLLSYFLARYSARNIYSIVDLSKTVFIFLVSVFSIYLVRTGGSDGPQSFIHSLATLRAKDILFLFLALMISSAIDYFLFRCNSYTDINIANTALQKWTSSMLFTLRIYFPLIVFALVIYFLTSAQHIKLNLIKVLFLFAALWLFNEFTYEFSLLVRGKIFFLLGALFDENTQYYVESILAIPLVAFFFLGFFSALTTPIRLLEGKS